MHLRVTLSRQARIVALLAGFIVCHILIASCLPHSWAWLSTWWTSLSALSATATAFFQVYRERWNGRVFWLLLALALFLQTVTLAAEGTAEMLQLSVNNHASELIVLPSVIAMVPLLLAVSLRWNTLRSTTIVKTFLAFLAGVLFFQIVSDLLSPAGASLQQARTVVSYFDMADLLLCLAFAFRLIGAVTVKEKRFFYASTIFLVADTVCSSLHNRILLRVDSVCLDLLLTLPYVLFIAMMNIPLPDTLIRARSSRSLKRMVRGASPMQLCLFVVGAGLLVSRDHFARGAAGIFIGMIGYGILNTLIHAHALASEEALIEAREELEKMAGLDPLTGIANRRTFDRTFSEEWQKATKKRRPLSLLMIDIDHFKQLNDLHGHHYGDVCLVRVAATLSSSLPRSRGIVARYGGEEFVFLLPQTSSDVAAALAERVRARVHDLCLSHTGSPFSRVTVSIGVATANADVSQSPLELLKMADVALYRAKRNGRNLSEIADSVLQSLPDSEINDSA